MVINHWHKVVLVGVVLAGLVSGFSACAQQPMRQQVPQSREQITLSFAPVAREASKAVVNVYTRTVVRTPSASPLFDDPFFRRFFGENSPFGAPRERVQSSLGSGVIVDPSGLIVTNNHVIRGSTEINVVLPDRREFDAKIVLADERTDLAVLRIDAGREPLPVLRLHDSDDLEVGDLVLAIGNPFGVGQTVTSGIVSALSRTAVGISDYSFFIQTDAAINPGNSGGALVAMDGSLVGINTAIFSRSGGSLGIGFAIPSNMVRAVLAGLKTDGKIIRPWFGASTQAVTADLAANLGLARPEGVLISSLHPQGPARRAGLQVGDIVTRIDGREIYDTDALRFRMATLPVGGTARIEVLRGGGQRTTLTLPLEAPPETPRRDETMLRGNQPLAGATVANLSPALADELAMSTDAAGVVVLKADRGSVASRFGLRPHDVILAINGTEVESVADLRKLLGRAHNRWQITLRRGDEVMTLVVG